MKYKEFNGPMNIKISKDVDRGSRLTKWTSNHCYITLGMISVYNNTCMQMQLYNNVSKYNKFTIVIRYIMKVIIMMVN